MFDSKIDLRGIDRSLQSIANSYVNIDQSLRYIAKSFDIWVKSQLPGPPVSCVLQLLNGDGTMARMIKDQQAKMKDNENKFLNVQFLDGRNNPVSPTAEQQPITFVTDNTDLVTLGAVTGTKCPISAVGPLGNCVVTMKTNDNTLTGVLNLEIEASAAVTVDIQLSDI
jgi:hypothetical protein